MQEKQLKINHDADSNFEAIGVTEEQVNSFEKIMMQLVKLIWDNKSPRGGVFTVSDSYEFILNNITIENLIMTYDVVARRTLLSLIESVKGQGGDNNDVDGVINRAIESEELPGDRECTCPNCRPDLYGKESTEGMELPKGLQDFLKKNVWLSG